MWKLGFTRGSVSQLLHHHKKTKAPVLHTSVLIFVYYTKLQPRTKNGRDQSQLGTTKRPKLRNTRYSTTARTQKVTSVLILIGILGNFTCFQRASKLDGFDSQVSIWVHNPLRSSLSGTYCLQIERKSNNFFLKRKLRPSANDQPQQQS